MHRRWKPHSLRYLRKQETLCPGIGWPLSPWSQEGSPRKPDWKHNLRHRSWTQTLVAAQNRREFVQMNSNKFSYKDPVHNCNIILRNIPVFNKNATKMQNKTSKVYPIHADVQGERVVNTNWLSDGVRFLEHQFPVRIMFSNSMKMYYELKEYIRGNDPITKIC